MQLNLLNDANPNDDSTSSPEIQAAPPLSSLEEAEDFAKICKQCKLCDTRTQAVFARGNPKAQLMIIGEGPGQQEDQTGLPFVGKAGQLLDKILDAAKISKEKDVYICNVVKCRPPRKPSPYGGRGGCVCTTFEDTNRSN